VQFFRISYPDPTGGSAAPTSTTTNNTMRRQQSRDVCGRSTRSGVAQTASDRLAYVVVVTHASPRANVVEEVVIEAAIALPGLSLS
jgi:hypothetical protein